MKRFSVSDWRSFLGRSVRDTSWSIQRRLALEKELIYDVHWVQSKKGILTTIVDNSYPFLLRQIPDPPLVLFVRGNLSLLSDFNISIVGTRKPDKVGRSASFVLGKYYSERGYNIVSGLAYGIDVAAHRGVLYAIENKVVDKVGCPIVVLGTSIDFLYPRIHIPIGGEILKKGGVIVSEIPPRMTTQKYNFIGRNRIISGLSMDTIVVQSPKKSGALATADFAIEQGRNLWVHKVGLSNCFEGTLTLYANGAGVLDNSNMDGIFSSL